MCQPTTQTTKETPRSFSVNKSGSGATEGHPTNLDAFYRAHPSFIWGPILVAAFLCALHCVPLLRVYLESKEMQVFGLQSAVHYTVFAIVSSYAMHGWVTTHAPQKLKIQSGYQYEVSPQAMAVRSTAALLTELIYAVMPLAPNSTSWVHFAVWTAVVAIYWDAHFYAIHRFVHENKTAYKFFHKTHHLCKEPNCFGAYFVTYQSHIVLEQLVVFIMAMAGLPRDVFVFTMYWGTIATYIEHCGFEIGSIKLPLVPLTIGNLCTLLSLPTSWLDGVNVAEHDWHHEKFLTNYSLSFKYLDKIFGTYHSGRVPGEQGLVSGPTVKAE